MLVWSNTITISSVFYPFNSASAMPRSIRFPSEFSSNRNLPWKNCHLNVWKKETVPFQIFVKVAWCQRDSWSSPIAFLYCHWAEQSCLYHWGLVSTRPRSAVSSTFVPEAAGLSPFANQTIVFCGILAYQMESMKRSLLLSSEWKPKAKSPLGESHEDEFCEAERETPMVMLPRVWAKVKNGCSSRRRNESENRSGKAIATAVIQ